MHTIDLLRGQGIPPKATFGTVALVIVFVAVPILAAAVLLDRYLQNREVIAIDQRAIAKAQQTIDLYAADVRGKEQMEKQQSAIDARLKEVKSCLGDYVQWSPVLMDLVENMPADMVMNKLAAETRHSRERVVKGKDPNRPVTVNVTRRTLVLEISGIAAGSYDGVVRDYAERLRKSPVLGPKLENIVPSQKTGQLGDDKTVSYTMNLIFKAGS